MITRISGPLTRRMTVIKAQATPAFSIPFVARKCGGGGGVLDPAES